jgi:hypothetical protein
VCIGTVGIVWWIIDAINVIGTRSSDGRRSSAET